MTARVPNEIDTFSKFMLGWDFTGSGWVASSGTTNLVTYHPLYLPESFTFNLVHTVNGGAGSGNFDLGFFRQSDFVQVFSMGSTPVTGAANVRVEYAVTETTLPPGAYYMGVVRDSTVAFQNRILTTGLVWIQNGMGWEAATFPLPATMAPSRTGAQIPLVSRVGIRRTGSVT